jgi:hypothetical protein
VHLWNEMRFANIDKNSRFPSTSFLSACSKFGIEEAGAHNQINRSPYKSPGDSLLFEHWRYVSFGVGRLVGLG